MFSLINNIAKKALPSRYEWVQQSIDNRDFISFDGRRKKRENMQVKPVMIHQSTSPSLKGSKPNDPIPRINSIVANAVGEHELRKIMENR